MTSRGEIDRRIFALLKAANVYAAYGNAEDANTCRDQISELEREKQALEEREKGR
jgi:hypothetical protein